MPPMLSPLRRQLHRAGLLLAGRRRHARAFATLTAILRIYGPLLGGEARRDDQRLGQMHARAAEEVRSLCARNGASWVKAAQFFSCRPDVLPREYINALQTLQNDARPVPFAALEPVLRNRWGNHWEDLFEAFDRTPVATASIAQVHRARLRGGGEVAVKIRLPDVVEQFRQDEASFRLLAQLVAPLVRELDVRQVTGQLLDMTRGELDFRTEADNLARFSQLPHRARIRVPALHAVLSHEDVLVTGWVAGERLRDHLDAHPERAADLLGELFRSYIQQVTVFGIYQADPHPGNFLVDAQGNICILDFGALAEITPQEREDYARLLFACVAGQVEGIGALFEQAGFRGGDGESLQKLAGYVLGDRLRRQGLADGTVELLELFREHRVQIPDSYIPIARVLITVGGFLMAYGVPFAWDLPGAAPG